MNTSKKKLSKKNKLNQSNLSNIYLPSLLNTKILLNINNIGSNFKEILKEKMINTLTGKCIEEGYLKSDSIEIINYSAGLVRENNIEFSVTYECLLCNPCEGMIIDCKVENITLAGIKARLYDDTLENPIIVFVARDHNYLSEKFSDINVEDKITIKIVGSTFEINDKHIYVIGNII